MPASERERLARETRGILLEVFEAQNGDDINALNALVRRYREALGPWVGVPEDVRVEILPMNLPLISPDQVPSGFDLWWEAVTNDIWWSIGDDPSKARGKPRAIGSVIVGCVAAVEAGCVPRERLLDLARNGADYLLWAQSQADAGLIPFPAREGGSGKVFQIADRAIAKLDVTGRRDGLIRNGWFIDDAGLDNGGLQLDNGVCGVALLELARMTDEGRYRTAALRAADWVIGRKCVPNWNDNAFSIELLAEAYRETSEARYLDAARTKVRFGLLPCQLREGPRAGRWVDPHNAKANYHYIILRALIRLLSILPEDDPLAIEVTSALQLGLKARNLEIIGPKLTNIESAFEAVLLLDRLIDDPDQTLGPTRHREVIIRLGELPQNWPAAASRP